MIILQNLIKLKLWLKILRNKMQEEQKVDDQVNQADNEYTKNKNKSLATSVKRKNMKSGKGKKKIKNQRIIMSHSKKTLKGADLHADNIINMKTGQNFYKPGFNRVYSANVYGNPKLRRYEQVINKLKKLISSENKKLREIRTVYAREIESKTQLEQLLRQ